MLVLGGTGFIGRNLIEYFLGKKKYIITATHFKTKKIKSLPVNWINIDLRDPKKLKNLFKDFDVVLQFAATTSGSSDIVNRPYIHVTDNAVMNSLILREIFDSNIKHFIFPSCTVMYHSSKRPLKESDFNENKRIHPKYFGVGNTKVYIEKMCEFFSGIDQTKKYTVIRHSNLYGPYDKYDLQKSHMFGANITKVLKNTNGKIIIWGKGKEKRDLLYIKDFCKFVEKAIKNQKNKFELFNVGYGKDYSVLDIVKKIIKFSKKKISIDFDLSKPSIPTFLSLNCNKAKKELNWVHEISVDKGIQKTIKWYLKNVK